MAPTIDNRTTLAGVPAAPITHGRNVREVTNGESSSQSNDGARPVADVLVNLSDVWQLKAHEWRIICVVTQHEHSSVIQKSSQYEQQHQQLHSVAGNGVYTRNGS